MEITNSIEQHLNNRDPRSLFIKTVWKLNSLTTAHWNILNTIFSGNINWKLKCLMLLFSLFWETFLDLQSQMLTKGSSGRLISASYFCYFSTVFMGVKLKAFLQFVFFQLPNIDIKTCWVVPAKHYSSKYPETDFRASNGLTQTRGFSKYSQHFMASENTFWTLRKLKSIMSSTVQACAWLNALNKWNFWRIS